MAQELGEDESKTIVEDFRRSNPLIVNLWNRLHDACASRDGQHYALPLPCTQHSPSLKRFLFYRDVLVRKDDMTATVAGDRMHVDGGLIAENWTQATARDVLAAAWLHCSQAGFVPVLSVHDELVFELPEATAEQDLARIIARMETPVPSVCSISIRRSSMPDGSPLNTLLTEFLPAADFEAVEREAVKVEALPVVRVLDDMKTSPAENDPSELIMHRFLYRGGVCLLLGPTGVGKSPLLMQLAIYFALGKALFSITPGAIGGVFVQPDIDRAVISWEANAIGFGSVEYGTTTPGDLGTLGDNLNLTGHAIELTGLSPGTTYKVRVSNRRAIDGGVVASTEGEFTTLGAPAVCPEVKGYWKNNPDAWPASATSMLLGTSSYTKDELLAILHTKPGSANNADASIILAHQLIAAKLNIASGAAAPAPVPDAIAAADAAIDSNTLPAGVKPNSPLGKSMTALAAFLEIYNFGALNIGCPLAGGTGG